MQNGRRLHLGFGYRSQGQWATEFRRFAPYSYNLLKQEKTAKCESPGAWDEDYLLKVLAGLVT